MNGREGDSGPGKGALARFTAGALGKAECDDTVDSGLSHLTGVACTVKTTILIRFDEGPGLRLAVEEPVLLSMLELLPGAHGIHFRKNLKFAVVEEGGRRRMMSPVYIGIVEEKQASR